MSAQGDSASELKRRERENLDRAVAGHAAFNRGDIEAALEFTDPEIELHPALGGAFAGATVYRGHDGVRRYFADLREAFDVIKIEPRAGATCGDWIMIDAAVSGLGHSSEAAVETTMTVVWRDRDGKAVWGATYFDREEALRAIGVAESELTWTVIDR